MNANHDEPIKMNAKHVEHIRDDFGITFSKVEDGEAQGELKLKAVHMNLFGIPYGGVLFHLADLTSGQAFFSAGGHGVTVSANADFMRSNRATEKLICKAKTTRRGKRLFFVDARIEDDDGMELCKFSFIFSNIDS